MKCNQETERALHSMPCARYSCTSCEKRNATSKISWLSFSAFVSASFRKPCNRDSSLLDSLSWAVNSSFFLLKYVMSPEFLTLSTNTLIIERIHAIRSLSCPDSLPFILFDLVLINSMSPNHPLDIPAKSSILLSATSLRFSRSRQVVNTDLPSLQTGLN